jgi:hypothetical protein
MEGYAPAWPCPHDLQRCLQCAAIGILMTTLDTRGHAGARPSRKLHGGPCSRMAAPTEWRVLLRPDMSVVECHGRTGRAGRVALSRPRLARLFLGHPSLSAVLSGVEGRWSLCLNRHPESHDTSSIRLVKFLKITRTSNSSGWLPILYVVKPT